MPTQQVLREKDTRFPLKMSPTAPTVRGPVSAISCQLDGRGALAHLDRHVVRPLLPATELLLALGLIASSIICLKPVEGTVHEPLPVERTSAFPGRRGAPLGHLRVDLLLDVRGLLVLLPPGHVQAHLAGILFNLSPARSREFSKSAAWHLQYLPLLGRGEPAAFAAGRGRSGAWSPGRDCFERRSSRRSDMPSAPDPTP